MKMETEKCKDDTFKSNNSPDRKMSHKKWKAVHKKMRRKLKRQEEAKKRQLEIDKEQKEKENSLSFQAKLKEEEEREEFINQRNEAERAYLNKVWLEKEWLAQEEWKKKKEWEEKEKDRKLQIEKKIREEWEERQRKEKEEEDEKEKKKEKQVMDAGKPYYPTFKKKNSKLSHSEKLLKEATANENKDGPWHNPIATILPGKERETCMFFSKTGACRFGERCSRGHPQPEISNTLLFANMYNHFELEQGLRDELDTTDVGLEYEDSELYHNFQEFYDDIVPEFKSFGQVIQVKVCNNYEPHLRGNVYVQFRSEKNAEEACIQLNGRFYGGKQISCEFVEIKNWKSAICGLFGSGRCPKGRNCNFLHVFRNPGNEFWEADSLSRYGDKSDRSRSHRHRSRERSHRSKRSRSRSYDHYKRKRPQERNHRRHSRSKSRSRSQERNRKRHSRSRSRSRSRRSHRDYNRHSRSRSRSNRRQRSHSKSKQRKSNKGYHDDYEHNNKNSDSKSNGWDSNEDEDSGDKKEETIEKDKSTSSDSESAKSVNRSRKKHKKHKKHKHKSSSKSQENS